LLILSKKLGNLLNKDPVARHKIYAWHILLYNLKIPMSEHCDVYGSIKMANNINPDKHTCKLNIDAKLSSSRKIKLPVQVPVNGYLCIIRKVSEVISKLTFITKMVIEKWLKGSEFKG